MLIDKFNPQDLIAAAPDAIRMALGEQPRDPHPIAADMADAPLSTLADAVALKHRHTQNRPRASPLTLGTSDFMHALEVGVRDVIARRFDYAAEHRKLCGEIELKDFRAVDLPQLDLGDELPVNYELGGVPNERGNWSRPLNLEIDGCVRDAKLVSFARRLGISRTMVVNDQVGIIKDLIALMGNMAARTEAGLLFREMEFNPVLADGFPVFIEDANWIKSALDETSLAAAIAMMRNFETTSGNRADIQAAFLVVAPSIEFLARKLVHANGLPLEVLTSTHFAPGHWYLVSDPQTHPACAVLKLRGTTRTVRVEAGKKFAIDGVHLTAAADLGCVIRGRVGIVRGEPA